MRVALWARSPTSFLEVLCPSPVPAPLLTWAMVLLRVLLTLRLVLVLTLVLALLLSSNNRGLVLLLSKLYTGQLLMFYLFLSIEQIGIGIFMKLVGLADQDWGCAIGYAGLLSCCYLFCQTMSNAFIDSIINSV